MCYIAQFARELKLDSISFQKLRIEKFSPLKEVVENTPGYHYKGEGGAVYSDTHDLKDLRRIRNRIRGKFYTVGQLAWITRKVFRIGLLKKSEAASLLPRLPLLLFRVARRQLEKKKRMAVR